MIIDSFDNSKPLIDPKKVVKKHIAEKYGFYPEVMILTFSENLIDELLRLREIEIIGKDLALGAELEHLIYRVKGTNTGISLIGMGAPMATAAIEELYALLDCKKYIIFGSCGTLVDIEEGKLIVPTEAYRDEGVSYHYAKPADYIKISKAEKLAEIFNESGADYVKGKTWTTDAFFRETENNRNRRIEEGCICVEMEIASLQAVCDFRNIELYPFVYGADSLHGEWTKRILGNGEMNHRLAFFYLAKKVSERI